MKYTDEQFKKALEDLLDELGDIQNASQVEFKDKLDTAIDNLSDEIAAKLESMGVKV
jgi:hypothetical protein